MSYQPVARMLADWRAARLVLAALERQEHPDIEDRFGRVWVWKSGDLYTHDATLAFPAAFIDWARLPSPELAGNPNYARLCAICRSEWPVAQLELFPVRRA